MYVICSYSFHKLYMILLLLFVYIYIYNGISYPDYGDECTQGYTRGGP